MMAFMMMMEKWNEVFYSGRLATDEKTHLHHYEISAFYAFLVWCALMFLLTFGENPSQVSQFLPPDYANVSASVWPEPDNKRRYREDVNKSWTLCCFLFDGGVGGGKKRAREEGGRWGWALMRMNSENRRRERWRGDGGRERVQRGVWLWHKSKFRCIIHGSLCQNIIYVCCVDSLLVKWEGHEKKEMVEEINNSGGFLYSWPEKNIY